MITISPCFLAHHRRPDGTYPAKMRVTFQRRSRWLPTTIYARPSQLTRSLRPKDPLLVRRLDDLRGQMLGVVAELSPFALEDMDIDGVVRYIKARLSAASFRLDFYAFAGEVISGKTPATQEAYRSALSWLRSRSGRETLDVNEVTAALLRSCLERDPIPTASHYITLLGHVFRKARERFNDDDTGVLLIPRDPFRLVERPSVIHRGTRALGHDTMQAILAAPDDDPERWTLDLFILSFALMGANITDLFYACPPSGGVWEYRRQKTRGRRADGALMRVPVPVELSEIIGRLAVGAPGGRWLNPGRAQEPGSWTTRVNAGLRRWCEREGVPPFTFYAARKTFATEARRAGVEKATIDECLAHVGDYRVADIYIERQWEVLWSAQRQVLDRFSWPD